MSEDKELNAESRKNYDPDHLKSLMEGQEPWLEFRRAADPRAGDPWEAFQKEHVEKSKAIRWAVNAWNTYRPEPALLEGANLFGAHLEGANLRLAHLEGANLNEAHLEGANLSLAHMERAFLAEAHLEGANLHQAHLEEAYLCQAYLEAANLSDAHLEEADLYRTNLEGAHLREAHMEGADVRGATGLTLDDTKIRNTRFAPMAKDEWSVLRRAYTGPRFVIMLLALIAFALPYVGKTLGWVAANRAQQGAAGVFESVSLGIETALSERDSLIVETIEELRSSSAPGMEELARVFEAQRFALSDWLAEARTTVASEVPPVGDCGDGLACRIRMIVFPPTPQECQTQDAGWKCWRVAQLVVSADEGLFLLVPALLFILYNIARAIMTMRVAAMRDAEERSGYSPYFLSLSPQYNYKYYEQKKKLRRSPPPDTPRLQRPLRTIRDGWIEARLRWGSYRSRDAYGGLFIIHRYVLTPVLVLAVASFFLHTWHWLVLVVSLPQ